MLAKAPTKSDHSCLHPTRKPKQVRPILLLIEITGSWEPAKFLIKETRRITHNSIFADFYLLDFKKTNRRDDEIQNCTVKDQPILPTPAQTDHSRLSRTVACQ
jgi:hypothetical protein